MSQVSSCVETESVAYALAKASAHSMSQKSTAAAVRCPICQGVQQTPASASLGAAALPYVSCSTEVMLGVWCQLRARRADTRVADSDHPVSGAH